MKRFFSWLSWIVKIVLVVALAVWLYSQPGTMTIVWGDYTAESRIGTALLLFLASAVAFGWMFYLWRRLVALPGSFRQQRHLNRLQSGYAAIQKGLLALHLKDMPTAVRQAQQAVQLLPDQALGHYLAAETARQQDDVPATEKHLQDLRQAPDGDALGLYGLLELSLQQNDKVQALSYARQLHHAMGLTPFVADTLSSLETEQGHLAAAEKILRQALQTKHLQNPVNTARWRNALASVLLRLSDAALQRQDYPAALECAREALKWQPASTNAAQTTALLWQQRAYTRKARKTIATAYALNPQPELIPVWLQLHGAQAHNALDQIAIVERLVREQPDHIVSDLAMADANRRADLWGVARRHALKALEKLPADRVTSRAVYDTLIQIETQDGNDPAKIKAWRDSQTKLLT